MTERSFEVAIFELSEEHPYKVLMYEFISHHVTFEYGQGVTGYIETPVDVAPGFYSLLIHEPNSPRLRGGDEDKYWYAFFPVAELVRSKAGYLVFCNVFQTDALRADGLLGAAAIELIKYKRLKLTENLLLQAGLQSSD